MPVRSIAVVLAGTLAVLPLEALPASAKDAREQKQDFVGVFTPVITGLVEDAVRCPDPTHPLLLTFVGEAYTTLGHATFEQSHCEDRAHTSFRRGEEVITFANGDVLFGAYNGVILATPTTGTDGRLILDGSYRNMGGTGRLVNAQGRGVSAGVFDTLTGITTVTVSGTL